MVCNYYIYFIYEVLSVQTLLEVEWHQYHGATPYDFYGNQLTFNTQLWNQALHVVAWDDETNSTPPKSRRFLLGNQLAVPHYHIMRFKTTFGFQTLHDVHHVVRDDETNSTVPCTVSMVTTPTFDSTFKYNAWVSDYYFLRN